jgi:hypothetical protein
VRSLGRLGPRALFAASSLVLAGACLALVRSGLYAANPDVAAWGITFDLTITLPLLYWFFVVRSGKARALTIAPVFLAGSLLAAAILPAGEQRFLHDLRRVAGPLAEVILIVAIVRRVVTARRDRTISADPGERIAAAAQMIAGDGRVASVIASELSVFYYALFTWRRKPHAEPGSVTFHERNGWSTMLAAILLLIAFEGLGMHILLARWSVVAAWGWTTLDIWAAIWLLGDFQALRLRRTAFDGDTLHLRLGLRWSAAIPRENIARIEPVSGEEQWKRRGVLKVAILDEPRWLVTLREPVVIHGMAGIEKRVDALALLPDEDGWIESLRSAAFPGQS